MNKLLSVPDKPAVRGLITASGGNHGLGVAYAAYVTGMPANIYLPTTTPAAKIEKLRRWGADTIVDGETWDQSNRIALSVAQRDGLTYIHAFADPMVIAGQGTVGLEILQEAPEIDTIVVAAFDRAYGSRRRVGCVVGAIANHKGSMVTARRGHRIGRWRPARHRFPLNARERGCITTGLGLRKF